MSAPGRRTIPLTKAQMQTAAGAELLALCQTVTEDGSIADHEMAALRAWLDLNRSSDLPSVEFLTETVEKILADGRVDDWERRDLHKALERVLPPDARRKAAEARGRIEVAEARDESSTRHALRPAERVGPLFDFMVAGVGYENRDSIITEHVNADDDVYLVRDRANRYSKNAVEVRIGNGAMIGYVPEELAREMAPLLDGGHAPHAWVKKILADGRFPVPVVVAEVLRKDGEQPTPSRANAPPAVAVLTRADQPPPKPVATASVVPRKPLRMRCVAHLDSVARKTERGTHGALEKFADLVKPDLESLNERKLTTDDLEDYVAAASEILPALDRFFLRNPCRDKVREHIFREARVLVQQAFQAIRTACVEAKNRAAAPSDGETYDRMIALVDGALQRMPAPWMAPRPESVHPALIVVALVIVVIVLAAVAR